MINKYRFIKLRDSKALSSNVKKAISLFTESNLEQFGLVLDKITKALSSDYYVDEKSLADLDRLCMAYLLTYTGESRDKVIADLCLKFHKVYIDYKYREV